MRELVLYGILSLNLLVQFSNHSTLLVVPQLDSIITIFIKFATCMSSEMWTQEADISC